MTAGGCLLQMMDIPGLCIGEVEPYVLYKINVDMVDTGSRNTWTAHMSWAYSGGGKGGEGGQPTK